MSGKIAVLITLMNGLSALCWILCMCLTWSQQSDRRSESQDSDSEMKFRRKILEALLVLTNASTSPDMGDGLGARVDKTFHLVPGGSLSFGLLPTSMRIYAGLLSYDYEVPFCRTQSYARRLGEWCFR